MTEERRLPAKPQANSIRVAARRPWAPPTLTTVDVTDVTGAGGPGVTDSGVLS